MYNGMHLFLIPERKASMGNKMIFGFLYSPMSVAAQIFLIYSWLSNLPKTDSFFSVYCFFSLAGLWCLFDNLRQKPDISIRHFLGSLAFSAVFSLSVIAGNYGLFEPFTALMSIFNMSLCFAGGCVMGLHILLCVLNRCPMEKVKYGRKREKQVFFLSFFSIIGVDLVYLFFTNYPAIVHYDTVAQLTQILGLSPYSNWTPYWHTRTIGVFLNMGYELFGDINQALALCEVVQVVFIAGCFAYSLVTLYELGLPRIFLGLAFFLYVLFPYNIVFNVTLVKDVLFGVALLLMLTAWLRILSNTGKFPVWNYILFALGSVGFCLWRTNGWYVYLITALVLLLVYRGKRKALLAAMAGVLVICWVLTNPYLEKRNVEQAPFTETLAVPFQQIGRLIVNEREIPAEDEEFLSEIFHLDQVKELYRPESVDPMKFEAFRHGNSDFLEENFGTFLKIWLRLGIKYPGDYLIAWVDETRGYWNGGYHMGVYEQGIPDNTMGMYVTGGDNMVSELFAAYFRYVEDPVVLEPLKSIGFSVWLVLACWWITVLRKREISVLSTPVLVILVGLWIGTPVFAEFRYAYPVFLVSPLIGFAALFDLEWT